MIASQLQSDSSSLNILDLALLCTKSNWLMETAPLQNEHSLLVSKMNGTLQFPQSGFLTLHLLTATKCQPFRKIITGQKKKPRQPCTLRGRQVLIDWLIYYLSLWVYMECILYYILSPDMCSVKTQISSVYISKSRNNKMRFLCNPANLKTESETLAKIHLDFFLWMYMSQTFV